MGAVCLWSALGENRTGSLFGARVSFSQQILGPPHFYGFHEYSQTALCVDCVTKPGHCFGAWRRWERLVASGFTYLEPGL